MSEKLEHWVERLSGSGLPVFAKTVREVSSVTTDRGSSARDLSDVVSHDAAMTARLIRIANSSLFNPQSRQIDTISAAVVLMGFDAVRDLAVSLSLIDELAKSGKHLRIARIMARAFHAAVQANSLARQANTRVNEEVFVAALLKDIGEMAFWSKGGDATQTLDQALESEEEEAVAQQRELGFTFAALSRRLAEKWSLGELAQKSHNPDQREDVSVNSILSGHELAQAYEQHGWDSPESRALITRVAKSAGIAEADLRHEVERNIEEATDIARKFGVSIDEVLPPVVEQAPQADSEVLEAAAGPRQSAELQMEYLDRLAVGLEDGLGRDELMQMLVDGLCHGLGACSSYFMLLSPDRERLLMKYAAGAREPGVSIALEQSPILANGLGRQKPEIVKTTKLADLHANGEAIVSGVQMGGREIGVLYVERSTPFTDKAVSVFRQFSQQVVLVLTQAA